MLGSKLIYPRWFNEPQMKTDVTDNISQDLGVIILWATPEAWGPFTNVV